VKHAALVALALAASGCSPLIGLVVRAAASDGGEIAPGGEVSGTTRGAADRWQPSCGAPAGGGDRAFVFVPPRAGTYRVEVEADYDSVLAVFDEGGEALDCNDDHDRTSHSLVERRFEAGRRYTLVVDGYRGATGGFRLRVSEPAPEEADGRALTLGEREAGDTSGNTDHHTPPCGATAGSPDERWVFTPPEAGAYQVEVTSLYDAVVAIYAPGATEPLACNDDHGSTRVSQVTAQLEAGVPYAVVVDGYHGDAGRYRIVARAATGAAEARALTLGAEVRGDTTGGSDSRTPPCGARPGSPDDVWRLVPPRSGSYVVRLDSDYDGLLAVYRPGVDEPIGCNDDHGSTRQSEVVVPLIAGQDYEVVVDGWGGRAGAYRLVVSEAVAGGGPLQLGQPARGDTSRAADQHTPSCGASAGSPDDVWTFTPAETQQIRVDVDAEYDSVVAVLDAQGQELGCNDDHTNTRTSRLEVTVQAGQTYRVVVDGFRGQTGAYRLRVEPLGPPPPPPPPEGPRVENITAMERRCGAMPTLAEGTQTVDVAASEADARTSCGGFGPGPEALRRLRVTQETRLQITARSPHQPVLELRTGCSRGHHVVACDASQGQATLSARLEPNVDYTLLIDTRRGGDARVELEVQLTPIP